MFHPFTQKCPQSIHCFLPLQNSSLQILDEETTNMQNRLLPDKTTHPFHSMIKQQLLRQRPSRPLRHRPATFRQITLRLFQNLDIALLRLPQIKLCKHLRHGRRVRTPHLNMQGRNNLLQVCCVPVSISNERPTAGGRAVL